MNISDDPQYDSDRVAIIFADRSGWSTWQPQTEEAKQAPNVVCKINRQQVLACNGDYIAAYTRRALSEFMTKMGQDVEIKIFIEIIKKTPPCAN